MNTTEKIVIIGFGWVGQANAIALSRMGYEVAYYDPAEPPRHHTRYADDYPKLWRLSDPRAADGPATCYIVCVGDRVSDDGVQDIAPIQKALESLAGVAGTVVLRSTVLPDLLAPLAFDFYVPEFLHEKQAVEECIEPYVFVVGARGKKTEPSFFEAWRAKSYKVFSGTPAEASHIKYLWNLWNAVRIAFVNEFGTTIADPTDKDKLAGVERIVNFMFDHRPYMRYGKSFKGHCLPKDMRSYTRWYADKGRAMSLLAGAYASNRAHEEREATFPILPEWYSAYPERHISAGMAVHAVVYAVTKRLGILKKPQWNR
jgi:GDP-mannose 6-dehydrogenase